MASTVEILLRAKNDTDAAFKSVIKNLEQAGAEAKKTNQILGQMASDMSGALGGAASNLSSKLGPLGSALGALGPFGVAAAAGLGALTAAVTTAVAITVEATQKAMAYGDSLAALADRTGLSVKALQSLEVAAKLGNSSLDSIAAAVNRMQKAIFEGSGAFARLGLDLAQLRALSPEDQFKAVATAIESIVDPTERAAARIAVFGKSGNELASTLKAAAAGAGELGGALSDEAVAGAAALQDQADLLETAWDRVVLQFGAAVAQSPELRRALEDITDALVSMAKIVADLTPRIVAFVDKFVMGMRIAASAAVNLKDPVTALSGGLQRLADDIEQIKLDALFSDVASGATSTGIKIKGSFDTATKSVKGTSDSVKQLKEELEAAGPPLDQINQYFGTLNILTKEAGTIGQDFLHGLPAILREAATQTEEVAEQTFDWNRALDDGVAIIDELANSLQMMGVRGDSTLAHLVMGFQDLAHAAQDGAKAFASFASGDVVGGILGGIKAVGGLVSGIKNLFGGAKRAREEMEKLKSTFISSQGGMAALQARAREAGITLDAMFRAKSAGQLSAAIDKIKAQLETWGQAQQDLADAMERYGLTVDQMGPRFAQQQLDQQAAQLIKDFALLTQAGASVVTVTGAMADELNAYVNSALKSGATIPESMRKIIDALFAEGKLLHENGEAYTQAEKDGLNYTQTMSEQFAGLMQQIQKLVEALARGFNVPVNFHYTSSGESSNPAGNSHQPPKNLPEGAGGFIGTFPPTGGMAMLHNREAVVPLSDPGAMAALGAAIASAISASGGGGSQRPIIVRNELAGRPLDSYISNRMRQRGIRSPQQQRGGRTF